MLKFIIAFIMLLATDGLRAWPENARVGYTACNSCHVSPSGGGVLSEYGKGLSTELVTFSKENQGFSDWGMFETSKHVLFGGNVRNVYLRQQAGEFYRDRAFLMQADLELALVFGQFTFAGTAGYYGVDYGESDDPSPQLEYRRYYGKVQVNDNTIIRAGKFFPNFGLMIDDHTESIRTAARYGQGKETHNFEAGFYNELFGLILSMAYDENETPTDIVKTEFYLGKRHNASVSLQMHDAHGDDLAFALASGVTEKWYVMSEVLLKNLMDMEDFYYFRTGYEAYKGVLPYFKYTEDTRQVWSYGLQLLPVAHFELLLETSLAKEYGDFVVTTNYYW